MTPWLDDGDLKLYHGDCLEVLRGLPDRSVDAIVTSPPYADTRSDYEHVAAAAYPSWFAHLSLELYRVLGDDGSMMLNLGRVFRNGVESSYVERTLIACEDAGWARIDTIIWHKKNALPNQHRELHRMHEYVYWLAKSPDAYRGFDEERRPYAESTLPRYERVFKAKAKNVPTLSEGRDANPLGAKPGSVFVCSVGREKGNPHPAPMADDLARYLVRLSCPSSGTVLDPFAGSGTTLKVARDHGRHSVGIELNEEYLRIAADRLAQQSLLTGEAA